MKTKITLIKLGHVGHLVDFEKLKKWKSNLFEIVEIQCVEHLPNSTIEDGYYDQKYSVEDLKGKISCPKTSDIAVSIMMDRFIDNFYMHRVGSNCAALSLYRIPEILSIKDISIENFIIRQLYEICAFNLYYTFSDEVYEFVHRDTRGCLFDMNGDRTDILHNTEKPIICEACRGKLKTKQINADTINLFEKELKKIEKPLIQKIERCIKKYPFVSMFISAIVSAIIAIGINEIIHIIREIIYSI